MKISKKITNALKKYNEISDLTSDITKEEKSLFKAMTVLEHKYTPVMVIKEIQKIKGDFVVAKRFPEAYDHDIVLFKMTEDEVLDLIKSAIQSLKKKGK